jgi:hypothetical protein
MVAQTCATEGVATNSSGTATASVNVTTSTANDWGIGIARSNGGAATGAGAGYTWRPVGGGGSACQPSYVDTNAAIAAGPTTPTLNFSGGAPWAIAGFGLKHG